MTLSNKFNINEIFYSIQGEGTRAGLPCVFVRFQGCTLRCKWCDTSYALEIKQIEKMMTPSEIINTILQYDCKLICITGGEPLYQKGVSEFLEMLCDLGYTVILETSGNIIISNLDRRIIKILDVKCPDSGMSKYNKYENFDYLSKNDEIKFVIASRKDYNFAKQIIKDYNLSNKTYNILLSPVPEQNSKELAEWILEDALKVRMQLQLHKFIWSPDTRGV